MTRLASSFTVVNHRVIRASSTCAWWREWQAKSCSACGTRRDRNTAKPGPRGLGRLESSEHLSASPVLNFAE
jgi:hypothetical protein